MGSEWRGQADEPVIRHGQSVLHEKDDQISAGVLDGEVAGKAMVERFRRNSNDRPGKALQQCQRIVC